MKRIVESILLTDEEYQVLERFYKKQDKYTSPEELIFHQLNLVIRKIIERERCQKL